MGHNPLFSVMNHVLVNVNVNVNIPDRATFCPGDRYLVVCWITKNWMVTTLLEFVVTTVEI